MESSPKVNKTQINKATVKKKQQKTNESARSQKIKIDKAEGAFVFDQKENRYIDYCGIWGPMPLGHNHPRITESLIEVAREGLNFSSTTKMKNSIEKSLIKVIPSLEKVILTNSNLQAVIESVNLAKNYTNKEKILRFAGCYHAHAEHFLTDIKYINNQNDQNMAASSSFVCEYNDLESATKIISENKEQIACIIVEPVASSIGLVLAEKEFLLGLKELATKHKIVLIFDESKTAFRISLGGAQSYFNIIPDLTILAKVIGGGLPLGAFGGKKEFMQKTELLSNKKNLDLSDNPIAITASISALSLLQGPGFYNQLAINTQKLTDGILKLAKKNQINLVINQIGSMFSLFFTEDHEVKNFNDVLKADKTKYKNFYYRLLKEGIFFNENPYESMFMSIAHKHLEIKKTLAVISRVFSKLN